MNPVQHTPGQSLKMCRARIAFVRETFRPRPLFRWLDDDPIASTRRTIRTPIFDRKAHRQKPR